MRLPVHELRTHVKELDLGEAKVYHLPNWDKMTHPERLGIIRQIATMRGRDPRIAKLTVSIIKKAGAAPREYEKQAAAILKWVQDPKNCYYVNEPGERLQDPIYTLQAGHGDCDDCVALLCALFESIRLPWKLVLSGKSKAGQKVRFIEGEAVPPGVAWAHIYGMVGAPPYQPTRWWFCEPTVIGVPLGWDVIAGDSSFLPEMSHFSGPSQIMVSPQASLLQKWWKPVLPAMANRSPAYEFAASEPGYGVSALGPMVGALVTEGTQEEGKMDWKKILGGIALGVVTGVTVSVLAGVLTPMAKDYFGVKHD